MTRDREVDDILEDGSEDSEGWDDVDEGGDEDEDEDEDEENLEIVSLLDDKVFPDAASMLEYCKEKFNFDFVATRDRLGLDTYGSIKLINFVRSTAKDAKNLPHQISETDIQDDRYLMPVLPDDALIMCLDDLPSSSDAVEPKGTGDALEVEGSTRPLTDDSAASRDAALQTLLAQYAEITKQFASYRLAVEQTLDKRWHADDDDSLSQSAGGAAKEKEKKDESQYYWEAYAHHEIHETMLKDTVRTEAYRDFIYNNKHLFAGKTVLDIGCGTGILSMFCAKAGAAHVYAIDKSAILDKARENVFNNNLSSTITCLRGRVEDITLPVDKVDIIVSEWMGYCLLYEAMLPSVLWARDRYLKPDTGILVPSHATIFVAPVSDPKYMVEDVHFWRNVYGFDMKAMQEGMCKEVRMVIMPEASVCGSASTYALDLYHAKVEDLAFKTNWASKLSRDVDGVDAFLIWFDNYFATTRQKGPELVDQPAKVWEEAKADGRVAFTTGPGGKETHWSHALLLVENKDGDKDDVKGVKSYKAGEQIDGTLSYQATEGHARGLSIKVEFDGLPSADKSQTWFLT